MCGDATGNDAVFIMTMDDRIWPLNGIARSYGAIIGAEPSLDPI